MDIIIGLLLIIVIVILGIFLPHRYTLKNEVRGISK